MTNVVLCIYSDTDIALSTAVVNRHSVNPLVAPSHGPPSSLLSDIIDRSVKDSINPSTSLNSQWWHWWEAFITCTAFELPEWTAIIPSPSYDTFPRLKPPSSVQLSGQTPLRHVPAAQVSVMCSALRTDSPTSPPPIHSLTFLCLSSSSSFSSQLFSPFLLCPLQFVS